MSTIVDGGGEDARKPQRLMVLASRVRHRRRCGWCTSSRPRGRTSRSIVVVVARGGGVALLGLAWASTRAAALPHVDDGEVGAHEPPLALVEER
jgi:hypothetical protein